VSRTLAIALGIVAMSLAGWPARAIADQADIPGHVVLAKAGAKPETSALIIWDATPLVVTIVNQNMTDADANALLEHDAVHDLAKTLKSLSPDATTVTMRVTYQKIGALNPEYGAPTFEGVERYALITANVRDLRGDRDKWMESPDTKPIPAWLSYSITGSLPPHH